MSLGTSSGADRLVVMARGLGTRMRKADPSVGVMIGSRRLPTRASRR